MKSDVPLKRLTCLRPADLLALLGTLQAEVLGVETLELPASKTSLDTLAVRFPDAPISLISKIRQVEEPLQLQQLLQAVLTAAVIGAVERLLLDDRVP